MTIREYQKEAFRTCAQLESDKLNLSHMVLGVCAEWSEFTEAVKKADNINCIEELVDMIWFIAGYCTFREYDLQDLTNEESHKYSFHECLSRLQDKVKKYVAYNKTIDTEEEQKLIANLMSLTLAMLKIYTKDVSQALQNNIDKLRVRFPDKFSEDKANSRNLESERKELEK